MKLRDYQQKTINDLYAWFEAGNQGNPCIVMPTGSGKSHVVASLCKDALQNWPETRVLMLTSQKELLEQNYEKMRQHWPGAPVGIFSAGMRRRDLGEPITFAGIQSVRNRAEQLGYVDLIIVDECHLISHRAEGGYRKLIGELQAVNPSLRVIGLTATPYRLGHGLITDDPAIFDAILEPVSIEELIYKGFLAILRSKITGERLSTEGVKKRGGEYIESDLQKAVNTDSHNVAVVDETIALAGDRRSWLFFCAGVAHAEEICRILQERGINAACLTGGTPKREREQIISDFRDGKLKALTNANILTTGFNAPNTDLIAMLRPTLSPVLYVQIAGRGMRPKDHTDHCLVLDFAGVVQTHGPITAVEPPKKSGQREGDAPVKVCETCGELVHLSIRVCPACGAEFPAPEPKKYKLHNDDIMGLEGSTLEVNDWMWRKHTSRTSGKEMLAVTYYGALSDKPITEYFPVTHGGYAGDKALRSLAIIARSAGADTGQQELESIAASLNDGKPPSEVEYRKDGKFFRVLKRSWTNETQAA